MEFKNKEEKVVYYSRYIPALMNQAEFGGEHYLSMYASSDGETYDDSADPTGENFGTSDDFKIKLYGELVDLAKSGGEAEISEELSSLIKRIRDSAPEEFLKEFPNE